MITVISIFAIIFTLVAAELLMVYKNYRENTLHSAEKKKIENLNYSSR